MNKILATTILLVLAFTTGFTCSKQTPEAMTAPTNAPATPPPAELPGPTQEQMAAPTQTEVSPPAASAAGATATTVPSAQPVQPPGTTH